MNILMIGNAYPPIYMGGESAHLHNLTTSLRRRGHRLYVAHPAPATDGRTHVRLYRSQPGIDVYRICSPEGSGYYDNLNNVLTDVFNSLREDGANIDLVHSHSNRFSSSVNALTKKNRIPLVTTIHAIHIAMVHDLINKKGISSDPNELALYTADTERQKAMCPISDRIIAISKAMASLVVKYFDADPQKVRRVYNGIDFDRLSNFSDQSRIEEIKKRLGIGDRTVILFAGRIEPVKGIQRLALACKDLCKRYDQIAFIFLGNGSADIWLRPYLSGCRNVHFVDWLAFDGVIPYYHLADIVVTPSLIEPFGLVAIESLACRTCVISSNADGLDEIVTHNVNGIKIPLVLDEYGDRNIKAEDIYSALEEVILEPKKRQSLAEKGVIRASEFTLDRMAEEVEKVYSEILSYFG